MILRYCKFIHIRILHTIPLIAVFTTNGNGDMMIYDAKLGSLKYMFRGKNSPTARQLGTNSRNSLEVLFVARFSYSQCSFIHIVPGFILHVSLCLPVQYALTGIASHPIVLNFNRRNSKNCSC